MHYGKPRQSWLPALGGVPYETEAKVKPASASSRTEAGPLGQPIPNQRRPVGGVVVHNQANVQVGGHLGLDGIEELAKLHGPAPLVAATNYPAGSGVQGGKERYRAVAQVIMGAPLHCPGRMGNSGLVRSNAWIRDFSSTHRTNARSDG